MEPIYAKWPTNFESLYCVLLHMSPTQQKLPCYSDIFFLCHIDAFQIACFSVIITEYLCVEITYRIVILTYKGHEACMVCGR